MIGVVLVRNELLRRRAGIAEEMRTARWDMPNDGFVWRLFWWGYIWSVWRWRRQADRNIRDHDSFWER